VWEAGGTTDISLGTARGGEDESPAPRDLDGSMVTKEKEGIAGSAAKSGG
jgi:hypothetical protein